MIPTLVHTDIYPKKTLKLYIVKIPLILLMPNLPEQTNLSPKTEGPVKKGNLAFSLLVIKLQNKGKNA